MTSRRRLSKDARFAQLIEVAWQLIARDGTDALTMGHLAEAAGITKPTVYEHFGTRQGLLTALYQDFEVRQNRIIDEAIAAGLPQLEAKARVIASSYVNCVLVEGREIPDLLAALSGSPQLAQLRKQCQLSYIEKCRQILAPFSGAEGLSSAALWGMLGAADALSAIALSGEITEEQASEELYQVILALVARSQQQ